jgi:dihydroneopterin aldolase
MFTRPKELESLYFTTPAEAGGSGEIERIPERAGTPCMAVDGRLWALRRRLGRKGVEGRVTVKANGSLQQSNNGQIWDTKHNYIRVMLRDVTTEAVGLHPWEQFPERPNRLVVNVEMFALLQDSLASEREDGIVNYDLIRDRLKTWPARPHTPLLETLLQELVDLCFLNPRVDACRVSILKPDIFNEAAGAGVEVYALRSDPGNKAERKPV